MYSQHYSPRREAIQTPQNEPIPGKDMSLNNAGGYSFAIDKWKQLDRFLILGTEGGTYYVGERKLTRDNAKAVQECINEDGLRVVNRIVEISVNGKAPKNEPALFALAMCSGTKNLATRQAALKALPEVARIGTHLFHFVEYAEAFRGWGRSLKKAISKWYNKKTLDDLVYQVIKYKQRDGWSHRDLLRLSHPKSKNLSKNLLFKGITKPEEDFPTYETSEVTLQEGLALTRFILAKQLAIEIDPIAAAKIIEVADLPRECVNTQLLNSPEIWKALLIKMPLTAMIRNLGKMTGIGLLKPMSEAAAQVTARITNRDYILKSRLHPLAILVALKTYAQGRGEKGSLVWTPNQDIVDALNKAFYLAFDNVEPTNKRIMLALDVSGSMTGGNIAGMAGITPNIASAALALITAKTEQNRMITGFSDNFIDLGISPAMRLDDVIRKTSNMSFGGTDCALPMVYALENKIEADAFVVYTDSETWFGGIHPKQALDRYRQKTGINAKLVVVGMTANNFSIADPSDAGMLDICGFDTATPSLIADFIKN
jgi:60 kDa SS-A/Ro ribonucleoprotein